ncbi:hypothetical protein EBME_1752 [bacterium endosymbiont of Mortierella elongata FMR23-6]|nr:hypothetical protein EBME_1752 [bacterium endosymbiont of Mortierella elongata FMR23-6]
MQCFYFEGIKNAWLSGSSYLKNQLMNYMKFIDAKINKKIFIFLCKIRINLYIIA